MRKLYAQEDREQDDPLKTPELLIDKVMQYEKKSKEGVSVTADLLKQRHELRKEITDQLESQQEESEDNDSEDSSQPDDDQDASSDSEEKGEEESSSDDSKDDTDKDGEYTLEKVSCLGCCTLAPVVQIDELNAGGSLCLYKHLYRT